MNPSTEDFVNAISSISAQQIYILPNNSNIVLGQQARELRRRAQCNGHSEQDDSAGDRGAFASRKMRMRI